MRRLALTGDRRGDDDDARVIRRVDELEVGAQAAEGLGPAGERVRLDDERVLGGVGVEGDASEDDGLRERLDVLLRAQLGVEELLEDRGTEAQRADPGRCPGRCCARVEG